MNASLDLRAAVRARSLPAGPEGEALAVARFVAGLGGPSVRAVVFFGSRKTKASPDPWSAYDFFVLTRDYRSFYRSLAASGALRHSPALVAALNAVLPPNQISLVSKDESGRITAHAKCAVITLRRLQRETSLRRSDHFCLGRLFQPAEVLYAADAAAEEAVLEALVSAHAVTYAWVRPWLPARFDAEGYCRTLLRVSLGREIRPEPGGRADALWEAQEDYLSPVYGALLRALVARGELAETDPGVYSVARPAGLFERLRIDAYFRWSLLRATMRWFKYVVTFDDWLEYILRKARRHTGQEVVLTPRERRLPLVFLWPRLFRYLRQKDK